MPIVKPTHFPNSIVPQHHWTRNTPFTRTNRVWNGLCVSSVNRGGVMQWQGRIATWMALATTALSSQSSRELLHV